MRGLGWYLLLILGSVRSFYVPGVAPIDFQIEEKLDIKAVKMTSSKTQLPYEYYSLPMCKPETVIILWDIGTTGQFIVSRSVFGYRSSVCGLKVFVSQNIKEEILGHLSNRKFGRSPSWWSNRKYNVWYQSWQIWNMLSPMHPRPVIRKCRSL